LGRRIYLDHAATTPILPAAKAAMMEAMERWANPSSPHAEGRAARAALEDARERIKRALGWDGELIFTSGATEAIEIAMRRAKRPRCLVSPFEHDAVYRAAPDATVLKAGDPRDFASWTVDQPGLERELRQGAPAVVALQSVNSETGTDQLAVLRDIAPEVREHGSVLLSDCSQSAGLAPLPDADMIVVSAHKLGGPPGIGALLVRDLGLLEASGGQEQGYRGGTENVPAALGFAAALEAIQRNTDGYATWPAEIESSVGLLLEQLRGTRAELVAPGARQSPHILAIAMPDLSASAQLIQFDLAGIAVSAGSACSSGSLKRSRALAAFGVPEALAERTIRVSFGWSTTAADIGAFADAWWSIRMRVQGRAA
jgi:cysteine desulfurase